MAPRPYVDPRFPALLRRLRTEHGMSYRELARRAVYAKSYLHEMESGAKQPSLEVARRLDAVLEADGRLAALVRPATAPASTGDVEMDAVELARRAQASDVSGETLARLEHAIDDLATSYATMAPADLLPRIRQHLRYVGRLLDGRKTLEQHRRLLVVGGWLSLLGATVLVDLRDRSGASAHLTTAEELARHTEQAEIRAWCLETRAWDLLTDGEYRGAVDLSQAAQRLAPAGSSALIQATAQEGRAWARMGEAVATRRALHRVARLVSPLQVPDRPEHHYRYDPGKAMSYTATTLAWIGDPAAEEFAREVIRQLQAGADGVSRPRRVASARLDLALALLADGRPDEAADEAIVAVTSGRIVGSNWWRAVEILRGATAADAGEAEHLRDALQAYRPAELTSR